MSLILPEVLVVSVICALISVSWASSAWNRDSRYINCHTLSISSLFFLSSDPYPSRVLFVCLLLPLCFLCEYVSLMWALRTPVFCIRSHNSSTTMRCPDPWWNLHSNCVLCVSRILFFIESSHPWLTNELSDFHVSSRCIPPITPCTSVKNTLVWNIHIRNLKISVILVTRVLKLSVLNITKVFNFIAFSVISIVVLNISIHFTEE